jgi:hypothetical protein
MELEYFLLQHSNGVKDNIECSVGIFTIRRSSSSLGADEHRLFSTHYGRKGDRIVLSTRKGATAQFPEEYEGHWTDTNRLLLQWRRPLYQQRKRPGSAGYFGGKPRSPLHATRAKY